MDWNDDYIVERERTKLLTGIGCFFAIVILGLVIIFVLAKIIYNFEATQLKISHSPNDINKIEVVRTNDFPDPTIKIKYDDKYITKTKVPDNISVEWKNDNEANVILTKQGSETEIVKIEFK